MSDVAVPARWTLARVRDAAVAPLEVWNLPLASRRLFWEVAGTPFVESQRLRGVADVLIAREIAEAVADAARQLHKQHKYERLWVTGGLTALAGFAGAAGHALASVAFDPVISSTGAFAGEAGGREVLAAHGHAGGVVVDVGQTSIKVSVFPGAEAGIGSVRPARILRARHLDALPRQFIGAAPVTPASARAAALAAAPWIAESIIDALDSVVPRPVPAALVLGLPCPVDDAFVLGACTYGWAGDSTLVPRIAALLAASGTFESASSVHMLVLNDAELAAASLPDVPPLRTLVLTLGFGPGAALRG